MQTVHLVGQVLPDGFKLSIQLPIQTYLDVENNRRTTYLVNIVESVIGIEVASESINISDVSDITNYAYELARAAVDIFSFNVGYGLTVVLSRFQDQEGRETILVPRSVWTNYVHSSFNEQTIHSVPDGVIDWSYNLLASDTTIAIAVHSLIVGLSQPRYAELNCARAMECLRVSISPNCGYEMATWMNMHQTLNVSESYLRSITVVSNGPRHGIITSFPFAQITEVLHKSWTVMERFMELHRRQINRLPLEEFPILEL